MDCAQRLQVNAVVERKPDLGAATWGTVALSKCFLVTAPVLGGIHAPVHLWLQKRLPVQLWNPGLWLLKLAEQHAEEMGQTAVE